MALRHMREMVVPPGSRRARWLRRLKSGRSQTSPNEALQSDLALLRTSELFDAAWYLQHNSDVERSGMDAATHYLVHGGLELRDPSPWFSSSWYLSTYEDVRASGMNPLLHYLKHGKDEQRPIAPQQADKPNAASVKERDAVSEHLVSDNLVRFTAEFYPQYKIGRGTYGRPEVFAWGEGQTLEIGAFCSFAGGIQIYLRAEHRVDWVTTYPFSALWKEGAGIQGHPTSKGDVIIGNDVWIGAESIILSGVKIGDGAVIGTGSVVAQSVPPYAIVFGNPAKILRYRFSQDIIASLLEIAWWNWDDQKIAEFLPFLLNPDIRVFISRAQKSQE